MDLTSLTATEAASQIAAGELSSVALTRACLERIEQRNDKVSAFCHIDPAFSMAEAERADREAPRSPLHGVPFAVKDVIDTQDFPTECGSPIRAGRQPEMDAKCVSLMREAGAVLLGKVVTTEFAMFTPNATRHPLNIEHTPGGSSSGTAAAVCDRMVPIAFGNQTAGSLIRPAAYCGVYGLKPTHGTTDSTGIMPLQLYFDTLGYMARAIEDIQAFYGVVSGQTGEPEWALDRPAKIGLCQTFQWEFADAESRTVLLRAADCLARNGVDVADFSLPDAYADLVAVHRRVLYTGIAQSLAADYTSARSSMSDGLRAVIEEGQATSAEEYDAAYAYAESCRGSVNECFGDFDAIICPSAPGAAPRGEATGSPIFQVTWTLLGVPCLNLPVGRGANGLPIGIQLIGKRHGDQKLLSLGAHLMRNLPTVIEA